MAGLEDNLRRVPPQNLEAESSVLGGILLENDALNVVLELLRTGDFYRESHRKIFRAMIELSDRSEPVDIIILSECLKNRGELEAVGGAAYLASCNDFVPTAVNVGSYAGIVKEQSQRRELFKLFQEAVGRVDSEDPLILASEMTSQLLRINPTRPNVVRIDSLLRECLKDLEKAYESNGRIVGVPTGLQEFEKYYGGISRGDLVMLGGRTSQGKTSLAGTIAINAATLGYPVAFVSAESHPKKIGLRLISQSSQVENVRLQVGLLNDPDFGKITAAVGRLSDLPMWFIGGLRSWEVIKAHLRAIKLREPNLSLVIIDYVQLLSAPVSEKKRYLEISKISADAKGLAVEFNAAVGF